MPYLPSFYFLSFAVMTSVRSPRRGVTVAENATHAHHADAARADLDVEEEFNPPGQTIERAVIVGNTLGPVHLQEKNH